jgi:type I restriction enzyme S subunit
MIYEGNCRLGSLFKSSREKGRSGLPLLSVTMGGGLVDRDALDRKQDTSLTPAEHLLVRPGDIAYNTMRMWQGAFGLARHEGMVSPAYVVLRPNRRVDPEFASYLLKTPRLSYLLWAYSYGLTADRLRLYFADFAKIPALIPPVDKQKNVANILRTWDQAIAAANAIADRARVQKKALLQQLVPRIASHEDPPHGWQRLRLGDQVRINPPRPKRPADGSVSFVPMDAVSEDGRLTKQYERNYEEVCTGYSSFSDGDLLVAKITPCFENGKGVLLAGLRNGIGFGSTEFHVLRPDSGVNPRLLSHLVNSYEFRRRGESEMEGSAGQKRVTADFIRSFRFLCPSSPEMQKNVADTLDCVDDAIVAYTTLCENLITEKKAVSQRLFDPTRVTSK